MDTVDKATRSRIMASIRHKRNRTTEVRFRMILVRAGIDGWQVTPRAVPGNPDFVFPEHKLAIFVDGCFWHACPKCGHKPSSNTGYWHAKLARTAARDKRNRAMLRRRGWSVYRFWEHELSTPDRVRSRLMRALGRPREADR